MVLSSQLHEKNLHLNEIQFYINIDMIGTIKKQYGGKYRTLFAVLAPYLGLNFVNLKSNHFAFNYTRTHLVLKYRCVCVCVFFFFSCFFSFCFTLGRWGGSNRI